MNYTGPKVRISRKLGLALTPKASKVTTNKPYPPGQHGQTKRRAKQSDYGKQLFEKQKLKLQYNVSEKHMSNYFKKAARMVGNTGDLLVQLLETRLDSIIFRSGLARTIYAAKQFVSHGHILINGKKVDVSSYQLKPNDVISVKEKSRKLECFQEGLRNTSNLPYIEMSKVDFSIKLTYVPPRDEVPVVCDVPLVVEYYSR
jgi:small subunit ribosomal protein S4